MSTYSHITNSSEGHMVDYTNNYTMPTLYPKYELTIVGQYQNWN